MAVFISLLIIGFVVFIVSVLVIRAARSRSYRPDRMPSIDNSPSTSCDGTPDFLSIDTPDLSRKINGGHELKDMNSGHFIARSPFVPSPPVLVERFAEHVEMFDSNRQLLFQEEYEVSEDYSVIHVRVQCSGTSVHVQCMYMWFTDALGIA